MSYRWKQKKLIQDTIIDGKKVDLAFNNYCDVINGGIDRENIPINAITATELNNNVFGKMEMTDNLNAPTADLEYDGNYTGATSPKNVKVAGYEYGTSPLDEGGTWIEAASDTINCQEGMLSIRWRCNTYIPKYWGYYVNYNANLIASQKGVSWKIEIDGIEVYRTSYTMPTHWTHCLGVNVPVPAGLREVKVYWTLPPRKDDLGNTTQFYWYGGQITLHNRYR